MTPPGLTLAQLAETLADIEVRLSALETAVSRGINELAEEEATRAQDLAKVAWAVQHGRKRPW